MKKKILERMRRRERDRDRRRQMERDRHFRMMMMRPRPNSVETLINLASQIRERVLLASKSFFRVLLVNLVTNSIIILIAAKTGLFEASRDLL
jgi:hypothetical protein